MVCVEFTVEESDEEFEEYDEESEKISELVFRSLEVAVNEVVEFSEEFENVEENDVAEDEDMGDK